MTSSLGWVPATIPPITSKASPMEGARKKIQARHTRLKVSTHWRTTVNAAGSTGAGWVAAHRSFTHRSPTRYPPCSAPHTRKVMAAPCHSPPITIVRNRLR